MIVADLLWLLVESCWPDYFAAVTLQKVSSAGAKLVNIRGAGGGSRMTGTFREA
jgi:hypothetical protein